MQSYKDNAAKRDAFFEEDKRQKMAAAAAEVSASKAAKAAAKATFGVQDAPADAGDIFAAAGSGDLAIARKLETAAAAASEISHS